jgi:hypothetical protein
MKKIVLSAVMAFALLMGSSVMYAAAPAAKTATPAKTEQKVPVKKDAKKAPVKKTAKKAPAKKAPAKKAEPKKAC